MHGGASPGELSEVPGAFWVVPVNSGLRSGHHWIYLLSLTRYAYIPAPDRRNMWQDDLSGVAMFMDASLTKMNCQGQASDQPVVAGKDIT